MTNHRCITCAVLAYAGNVLCAIGIVVLGLWAVVLIALITAGWKLYELEGRYSRWRLRNKVADTVTVERPHRFWLKDGGFFL